MEGRSVLRPSVRRAALPDYGFSGVQLSNNPRASHSLFGTGITLGTLPPVGGVAGMSPSRLKRRASIQVVPCSHKSE